jgi:hypothetical protein
MRTDLIEEAMPNQFNLSVEYRPLPCGDLPDNSAKRQLVGLIVAAV